MGDVTNIDRDDANAKSDIDYMCVYVRVCVCVCVFTPSASCYICE